MGHVTSPEKMHGGAIAPYWIITGWIGIPSLGAFPLPSPPQACRARLRPPQRAPPATGAGPPATAHVHGWDPGRGTGHASHRARPRPPRQARARALRPVRTYAAVTWGAGLGTSGSVHIRAPEPGTRKGWPGNHHLLLGVWRPEVLRACCPQGPRAGALPRAGPRVWRTKLSLWDFLGIDATTGP